MSNRWKVNFIPNEIALEEILNKLESEGNQIYSIVPSVFSTGQSPTFVVISTIGEVVQVNVNNFTAEDMRTEPISDSLLGEQTINANILKAIKRGI